MDDNVPGRRCRCRLSLCVTSASSVDFLLVNCLHLKCTTAAASEMEAARDNVYDYHAHRHSHSHS